MICNVLVVGSYSITRFTSVGNFGVHICSLYCMDLNLSRWFVKSPAVITVQILPAVETACDRWIKKPVKFLSIIMKEIILNLHLRILFEVCTSQSLWQICSCFNSTQKLCTVEAYCTFVPVLTNNSLN